MMSMILLLGFFYLIAASSSDEKSGEQREDLEKTDQEDRPMAQIDIAKNIAEMDTAKIRENAEICRILLSQLGRSETVIEDRHSDYADSYLPDYIYHMTHIDNLASILEHGLYAHDNSYKSYDISDTTVNARRSRPEPVYRRSIHSYVPFYFNPKNPMLYVRRHLQHNIVILAVDSRMILEEGSLVTDGNAASGATRFYRGSTASLARVNWSVVNRTHYDYIKEKRVRMAETLVPDHVATEHIRKIICQNSFTASRVRRLTAIPVVVDKNFYF